MNAISFAHVSDLHLPLSEQPPRLRDLMSKRFFSWLSWRSSRRHIHRPETLAALMADVRGSAADHLIVTGDLTNLSLPDEFARARDWLAGQGGGETVTAIPGNHDALVPVDWAVAGAGLWREWMQGVADDGAFPFVKRLGGVALVGVSSATPTALFLATGRVGRTQLARLRTVLEELGHEGLFRVVLVHHPITEGAVSRRKALTDRAALRAVLAEAGAELVLHGHAHTATVESVPGPTGPIPVVGTPSASAAPGSHGPPAGWRRIDLEPLNQGWRLIVSSRTLHADGGVSAVEDLSVEIPRPVAKPTADA